ncbi:MAG: 50S ribosomal protein L30 [Chitinispirillaceae bacterium]|nr:50S ribosomal protein L30 [Chitinispirillaceae bacterium]
MATTPKKQLKITLVRSGIGKIGPQKRTIRALGLIKMHKSVVHKDTPVIRGMVRRVNHCVKVEEI